MRKIVQFMHASLDGFVAGPNGEMDWITVDDEIFDYAGNRTDNSDMALYGRATFEMMEGYWPTAGNQPNASRHDIEHSAWYNKVDKVVLSKSLKGKQFKNTKIISENVPAEVQKLKHGSDKEIIIFGSPGAFHSLMSEGLIDELWIFVSPIIVGAGIPLFKNISNKMNLKLANSHAFKCGVVCLHYERIK